MTGWWGTANASQIQAADIVSLGGLEWAQPDLFLGVSWHDINAACPGGVCGAATLNGFDMAGWNWATSSDVTNLVNVYVLRDSGDTNSLLDAAPGTTGSVYKFDRSSSTPKEFFTETGLRPTVTYNESFCSSSCDIEEEFSFGLSAWTSTKRRFPGNMTPFGAIVSMEEVNSEYLSPSYAKVLWTYPSQTNAGTYWQEGQFLPSSYGVWFNRDVSHVPLPAAVWLFGSAMLGLLGVAKRRRTCKLTWKSCRSSRVS
jgi:hypothetical protein